ncbi:MAG TPA: hypothetical protein ENN13_05015 [Candidatus Altiarchaeales archaeon]|nr:hypothetical protein [Candidatus Altiarchaeales archaeon]
MFTLGDLQRIYRLEKESAKLHEMPEDFHMKVETLLENPQAKEYEVEIKELYKKILNLRKNKILKYCMGPKPETPLENETTKDRMLRERILQDQEKYFEDTECPDDWKTPAHEKAEKKEAVFGKTDVAGEEYVKVKFMQDMPEMMGADGVKYGPFGEGMVERLPAANANILLKKNIAEKAR